MSRLSEADVQKSCKPKDAATEGFCFQQTMIRVKVIVLRVFLYIRGGGGLKWTRTNCPSNSGKHLYFLGYRKIIGILYWCAWNATDC